MNNDIINMPYPNPEIEKDFPDRVLRAAQFAPFSALVGYEDAVKETARRTDGKIELDEYQKIQLNKTILLIAEDRDRTAKITFFRADTKKSGGAYLTVHGRVKKIDEAERVIIMEDNLKISIDDIVAVERM